MTGSHSREESRRRLWGIIGTAFVALAVFLALVFAGLRVAGYTPYVVLSDSMAPRFQAGDLVYVHAADPALIEPGEVIAFSSPSDSVPVILHRVHEADREGCTFTTKGDANDAPDAEPVAYDQVIGTAAFAIPQLGRVSAFVLQIEG